MWPPKKCGGPHLGQTAYRALELECQTLTDIQSLHRRLGAEHQFDPAIVEFVDQKYETPGPIVTK